MHEKLGMMLRRRVRMSGTVYAHCDHACPVRKETGTPGPGVRKEAMPVDMSLAIRYGGCHEAAVLVKAFFFLVVELVTSIKR